MIQPKRAPVRPRVLSPLNGEAILLEDEIQRLIDAGSCGQVQLLGPPGSGKTTAMLHLAALPLGNLVVLLVDEGEEVANVFCPPSISPLPSCLLVFSTCSPHSGSFLATYHLAPWTDDDRIEYLLAVHRDRCASVMARLRPEDRRLLPGTPDLWQMVLDQLARDETIPDVRTALHRYLQEQLPDTDVVERAGSACLNALIDVDGDGLKQMAQLAKPGFEQGLVRVLRHEAVQLLLASERIATDLKGDADCDYLAVRLPRELVKAAGALVAADSQAMDHLKNLLAGAPWSHPMAASILHATGSGWLPDLVPPAVLTGAYLDKAVWSYLDQAGTFFANLIGARLQQADLSEANLSGADLSTAFADHTDLSRAVLRGAILKAIVATKAELPSADMESVQGQYACFESANLEKANLEDAVLTKASFARAKVMGANFRGADLEQAVFDEAQLQGAHFAGANLTGASLVGLRLREAYFGGVCFREAHLNNCDLEFMDLPGADFVQAKLTGALLTGSSMPVANFEGADLREAKLAYIHWEGAILCGADLRGATFHMGSSRSGLVFSPIACEGSRTGFYTDDFDEQYYKAPEDIRKANLCGADLRGALIRDVDFYLVDLRGALYEPGQEAHFRHCGAILESRAQEV